MRHIKLSLLATSAFALCIGFSTIAFAQSSIGVNAAVKGDVTISSPDQEAKQALVKDPVFLGQMIESKQLSSLQIMLKDQTIFTIGADCELSIDKFVYDPEKNNNSMHANVAKGMFRFMSGNISNSGVNAVSISTPVSSMGIRGTMVEGLIGAEAVAIAVNEGILPAGTTVDSVGATLFVLRGPGPNSTAKNKKGEITVTSGGRTVIVTGTNKAVFIPSAGAAPIVFSLSMNSYQNFSKNLRTQPTGPSTYKRFELDQHLKTETTTGQSSSSSSSNATNAGQSQAGSASGSGSGAGAAGVGTEAAGGAAGASTVVFGLGALAAVGAVIATQGEDEQTPISP